MSAQFDPYHVWLGIASKDQPPNHYRLLGIDLFESNDDVISNAADRQMRHVRSASTGEHVVWSQKLLNEISAARICLLNPEKKSLYDSQLRAALTDGKSPPVGPVGDPPRSATSASFLERLTSDGHQSGVSVPTVAESSPTSRQATTNHKFKTNKLLVGAVVGFGLLTLLVIGLLAYRAKPTTDGRETKKVVEAHGHLPSKEVIEPTVGDELLMEHENEQTPSLPSSPSGFLSDDGESGDNQVAQIEPTSPSEAPTVLPSVAELPQGSDEQSASSEPASSRQPETLPQSDTQTDPDDELTEPVQSAPPAKLAVPTEDAQRGALARIKDIFKDDYANATTDEGKKTLAGLLRQQAENLVDDPTARFVALRESYNYAVDARDLSLALRAVRQLVGEYELDELRLRIHMLAETARTARLPAERKEIAENAIDVLKQAVEARRFDDATTLIELAESLAVRARDAELRVLVRDIGNQFKQTRKSWESVQQAITVLKNDPQDPTANLVYGRFLAVEEDDWERGLPLLALGGDPDLKAIALKELRGAASPESQVALGDAWWELSEKQATQEKDAFRLRAGRWYKLAQPKLTSSLVRLTVEKRLEEINASAKRETESPVVNDSIDVLKDVDLVKSRVQGLWTIDDGGLKLTTKGSGDRIMIPLAVKGDYDLDVSFTREVGVYTLGVVLPLESRQCLFAISAKNNTLTAIGDLDGKGVGSNESSTAGTITNMQRHELKISVRQQGGNVVISAELDGQPHFRWEGMETALSLPDSSELPSLQCVGLMAEASARNPTLVTYHTIKLRSVRGTIQKLNVGGVSAVGRSRYPYYASKLEISKGGAVHDFPLGVLSATGRLQDGSTAIAIKDVGPGGPGEQGGLRVGDAIVTIDGKEMPPYSMELDAGMMGPQTVLATALDDGCSQPDPKLRLTVARNGEAVSLEIELPASPRYSRTFPRQCEKATAYRQACYQWLIDHQRPDGTWPGHIGGDSPDYQTSYVGLALLSSGNPNHLPTIKKAVGFVRTHRITGIDLNDPKTGPKNWIAAAVAIFLSEYFLATEDDSVLPDIQKCCDLLAKRVAPNGRMGHHFEITYGGGGLTIVNAHAHLAWSLADKCGCQIDLAAWNRSMGEVSKAMTSNGAVGYSSSSRGDNDAPARTGGMAAALVISGQALDAADRMGQWLIIKNNRMRHAHANCAMGLCFGTAGIKQANPRQLERHLQNWLPYLELSRSAHGSASYFGSKRNFGGDAYLGLNPLANATVVLMLASPEDNLFLFGGKTKGWFKS